MLEPGALVVFNDEYYSVVEGVVHSHDDIWYTIDNDITYQGGEPLFVVSLDVGIVYSSSRDKGDKEEVTRGEGEDRINIGLYKGQLVWFYDKEVMHEALLHLEV